MTRSTISCTRVRRASSIRVKVTTTRTELHSETQSSVLIAQSSILLTLSIRVIMHHAPFLGGPITDPCLANNVLGGQHSPRMRVRRFGAIVAQHKILVGSNRL